MADPLAIAVIEAVRLEDQNPERQREQAEEEALQRVRLWRDHELTDRHGCEQGREVARRQNPARGDVVAPSLRPPNLAALGRAATRSLPELAQPAAWGRRRVEAPLPSRSDPGCEPPVFRARRRETPRAADFDLRTAPVKGLVGSFGELHDLPGEVWG